MRIFKSHPLLKLANSYLIDSAQPSNLSYLWNFGSLLGFCLVIQIITGVTLAMHYNPSVLEAFNSVEHIMRDVNNGWLIRYLHSNTASAFFFLVYLHMGRGLYYGSYRAPRTLVWTIGTVIFITMVATAFLGFLHSPKWFKLNKHNKNNNTRNSSNYNKNLHLSFSNKGNIRHFSTNYRSLSARPKESHDNSIQEYSKDVLDFIKNNKLKPVYIYENLSEKSIQNKVLNDTKNIAGVYLILNKFNLSCYVGSGSTNKINVRFRNHLFNFSGSKIVKAAVMKYKINNFAFMVLEVFPEVVTKENNKRLLDIEDYYLKYLLPDYNIVTEAGNTFGYKHSEITRIKMVSNYSLERRLKIGNLNRGGSISDEHKENLRAAARQKPIFSEKSLNNMRKASKGIIVYNFDGTVYGEYSSMTSAAESLRCNVKTIRRALTTPKKILRKRWIVKNKVRG
jgi:group I intron endonuclease